MSSIIIKGGVKVTGKTTMKRFNFPPEWITLTGNIGSPFENQAFTVTPSADDPDNFPNPTLTFSISAGSLPSGIELDEGTGEISGTAPAVTGPSPTADNFTFTVRASDGDKFVDEEFELCVINDDLPIFGISGLSLGSVVENTNANASIPTITATDPNTITQIITFSETTSVLTTENLSIDTNTGVISGVPGIVGGTRIIAFTIQASTNTNNDTHNYEIIITDNADPAWQTPAPGSEIGPFDEGVAISTVTLTATDGNAITYSISGGSESPPGTWTGGGLAAGLQLNTVGGNAEITGTPDTVGSDTTTNFTVIATDDVDAGFNSRCFDVTITDVIAITNSLIFNDDDSAFLSRTPSAGNRTTWTFSTWMKRGTIGNTVNIFTAGTGSGDMTRFIFDSLDALFLDHKDGGVMTSRIISTAKFRDPSAWYHLIAVWDTDNGTANDRHRLYVNGVLITNMSSRTNPGSGMNSDINANVEHRISSQVDGTLFFDGYLAETIFVDGQALEPSNFGEFDANDDWMPINYAGTFGTNGFRLDFVVAPGTGNGGGTDVSGNGNHFTDNNLTASDQTVDTPIAIGSNYAVLNNLQINTGGKTYSEGNKKVVHFVPGGFSGSTYAISTIIPKGGKWYAEYDITKTGAWFGYAGIVPDYQAAIDILGPDDGYYWISNATLNHQGSAPAYGTTYTSGDTIQVALDLDNGAVWFGKNGTWQNGATQGEIETGTTTNAATTNLLTLSDSWAFAPGHSVTAGGTGTTLIKIEASEWSHTAPTGFLSLNTGNLPTPTIANPADYFDPMLYIGDASAGDVTAKSTAHVLNFQPDFVWIKNRSQADEHKLVDSTRGATKEISSDSANAEQTDTNGLTAFNADGFDLGTGANGYNDSGENFVAWNWKEGVTPGFDIVAYTGTGVAHAENHNLDAVPKMMIVKNRSQGSTNWAVYHEGTASDPETDVLHLNTNGAPTDSAAVWNDVAPTSTQFTVGTNDDVNLDQDNFIAYLWAEVDGFSKFGSYIGNGNADGPFVYCNFRPAFVMIKTLTVNSWYIWDSVRSTFNQMDDRIAADLTTAEVADRDIDFISNGFKIRENNAAHNTNAQTYVFMAFAESPFKTARAR